MELLSKGYAFTFKSRKAQSHAFMLINRKDHTLEIAFNKGTFLLESNGVVSIAIINGLVIEIPDNQ